MPLFRRVGVSTAAAPTPAQPATELWVVALATALALALRLYGLADKGVSLDESFSAYVASQPLHRIPEVQSDAHPPLYYVILHFVVGALGSGEFALRLPSVVFGTLSVPLLFLVGRRTAGPRAGAVGALLLSISYFHIAYSQEARMYPQLLFFALASMAFFLRGMEPGASLRHWAGYVAFTTLALYTHFFAGLLVGAQVAAALALGWAQRRKGPEAVRLAPFAASVALVLLSLVPLMPALGRAIGVRSFEVRWGVPATPRFFTQVFGDFGVGETAFSALFVAFFALGLLACVRQRRSLLLLSAWFFAPLLAGFVLASQISFHSRYLAPILPAYLLLVAAGVVFVSEALAGVKISKSREAPRADPPPASRSGWEVKRLGGRLAVAYVLLLVVVPTAATLADYYAQPFIDEDWREMARVVERNAGPGDGVVALGQSGWPLGYYYNNSSHGSLLLAANQTLPGVQEAAFSRTRVLFVVPADVWTVDPDRSILRWLEGHMLRLHLQTRPVSERSDLFLGAVYGRVNVNWTEVQNALQGALGANDTLLILPDYLLPQATGNLRLSEGVSILSAPAGAGALRSALGAGHATWVVLAWDVGKVVDSRNSVLDLLPREAREWGASGNARIFRYPGG